MDNHLSREELWKGHHVRAIDGTEVQLPHSREILKKYPRRRNHFGETHYPVARMVVAANVFTSQPTHCQIGNKHLSETGSLRELLQQFTRGDIAILDRGFENRKVWHEFEMLGQNYLARIRARGTAAPKNISKDFVQEMRVDSEVIRVRVIRSKTKNGSTLLLATNLLDPKRYTRADILRLYEKRQAVEDVFLNLKNTLHLKNIRSKKINGVLQEIYASLTMTSIAAGIRYSFEQRVEKNRRVCLKAIVWRLETSLGFIVLAEASLIFEVIFCDLQNFGHQRQPGRSYGRFSRQAENKWIKERRTKRYFAKKKMNSP